jgi:hypothetical protein
MHSKSIKSPANALMLVALCLTMAACGRSADDANPGNVKADAVVTFDGARHACLVALSNESQGSEVPCGEVAQFLKDELRVQPGSVCALRVLKNFDQAELARVKSNLSAAGYKLTGG